MSRIKRPYKWAHKKARRLLKIDFIRFCIVGTVGFVVTVILKVALFGGLFKLGVVMATFFSSEGGVISNFIFHERWTYNQVDHHNKPLWKKFLHFQASSLSGVVIFTFIGSMAVAVFNIGDLPSLMIAAGITMFWNFFWTKYFIFKGRTPAVLLHPEDTVELEAAD